MWPAVDRLLIASLPVIAGRSASGAAARRSRRSTVAAAPDSRRHDAMGRSRPAGRHDRLQRRAADPLHRAADAWGDPDLQGVWSSDDTATCHAPRRPQRRRPGLYLTDEEFTPRQKTDRRTASRAARAPISSFRGDFARRAFRQTSHHRRSAGRRAAAATAEARKRARTARSGHLRRRPVRERRRLHDLRPLHHTRHLGLGAARHLRQRQPHRPGTGHGRHQLRDDSRHARHLHRRPPAHRQRDPAVSRRLAGALGRRRRSSSRRRT